MEARLRRDAARAPRFLSRSSSSIGMTSTGMSMAPVFQSTEAGSGSEAIASRAVAVAALAPTCAEHPQTRKRNHPRHRAMDTRRRERAIMSISKCSSSVLKSCSSWALRRNCN